ncbi:MAG: NlpC/P60 family protein, partial [Nocardioidaceae bacterium]|nr:NlpC/P60 family protein [Nocardioidaceae bacterium]
MTLGLGAVPALGDPGGGSGGPGAYPSQDQVDRARAQARRKAQDVGAIKAQLLLANQRLEQAATRAEQASEAYNGAMWRLQQAKEQLRQARRDAARSQRTVARQRERIARLVAQSYQQGGDLNNLHAMLGADGPEGVLDQFVAFQGVSSSMDADYQRFAAAESLAEVFRRKAKHAETQRRQMADEAREAQQRAQAAAEAAQAEAGRIAAEKDQLIRELASAQHISVSLARQRQTALEEIARQRAEARARREAIAAAKAKAAAEANARAEAAARREA